MYSEMNVYFTTIQWQSLCLSIKSSWLTSTFFLAYLLPLCFIIEREMLKSPTINVFLSVSPCNYINFTTCIKHLFSSVQLLSCVQLFATPWTAARQASLSITNSWSLPKPMSIELVMPSYHLILCHPFLLLPSNFPSIRDFSNESAHPIRWPKDWSFSFSISPYNEHSGLISFRMDWLDILAVQGLSGVFSNTTVQNHQFLGMQLSL